MLRPLLSCWALFLLAGCSSHLAMLYEPKSKTELEVNELRMELADLKQVIDCYQQELQALDEKIAQRRTESRGTSSDTADHTEKYLGQKLAHVDKKIAHLESIIVQYADHLRQLAHQDEETTKVLSQYKQKLEAIEERNRELVKLRGTLEEISRALHTKPVLAKGQNLYKIQSGDTLEKIAKEHSTTAQALKKINGLTSDRILVGQEIVIAGDD